VFYRLTHFMKHIVVVFLCCLSLQTLSQITVNIKWQQSKALPSSDTIYYNSQQKLIWSNFKGKPVIGGEALAVTHSGFGFNAGVKYANNNTDINITVYCFFSKQYSWVIPGKESDYALTHEQHHFDVTYIAANLFIKKLQAAKFTRNNYNALLDKFYVESCRDLEKMQNDYDGKTRNGRLTTIQAEWNKKIDKQLASL
jgi:hypothetical protein